METSSTSEKNQSPESTRSVLQATRVKQFMNILEQLPRLCSPTICGTLSQPTTRAERLSRGGDAFEWSLEQKAILSPANITTDTEGTDEWQQNMAELNQTWRQQESEQFFSQRTIAPSPLIATPSTTNRNGFKRPAPIRYEDLMFEEEDEDEEEEDEHQPSKLQSYEFEDNPSPRAPNNVINNHDDSDTEFDYEDEEDDEHYDDNDVDIHEGDDDDDYDENNEQQEDLDALLFSPQPLRSSQTQQTVELFSPGTFSRVMEDTNTLQSTPKTTGSLSSRTRTRTRQEMLD